MFKQYCALVYTICTLFFTGCVPPVKDQSFDDIFTNYQIGETKRASIGDQLIKVNQGKFLYLDQYVALESFSVKFGPMNWGNLLRNNKIDIKQDEIFVMQNRIDQFIRIKSITASNAGYFIVINGDGKILKIYDSQLHDVEFAQGIPTSAVFQKVGSKKTLIKNTFSYELILTEINPKRISAIYREYNENYIKEAFSYPVVFNLDNTNIINFQSIKLEVIKVYDNQIDYRVLSD